MNKVILMGRLTADPELRQTQSGISSCRFTIAVNRRFRNDKGGYDADFVSCQAWRQTAEFITNYFRKGQMIAVEGSLRTGSYQDKNYTNVTHYTTDILVENVEFTGSKSDNSSSPEQSAVHKNNSGKNSFSPADFEEIFSDSDMPF